MIVSIVSIIIVIITTVDLICVVSFRTATSTGWFSSSNLDKFRPEVAGVAVDYVGMEVLVKFGDSMLNIVQYLVALFMPIGSSY